MPINNSHLYGLDEQHLVDYLGHQLEANTAVAFASLQQAALADEIDLQICSGFRNFDRQMLIWNAKATGKRAVLDNNSKPLTIEKLTSKELIDAILIWSAIPGLSRHHWGTDIDVFDGNMISKQNLQLVSEEYALGGPCFKLSQWLDGNAQKYGFYRPFQPGLSGVSPEAWHLSYFPIAETYLRDFDINAVSDILKSSTVKLREPILAQIDKLTAEYVYRVAPVPKS
ncbi:M15 family metallopeptidase [Shewanella sp. 10N.261.52.F9]|uniref:M15 family metallopeptidase n=1 Tax=Shewanella sp. 10N.261.52.F9 TaxID=3229684 RepID=UPI00354B30E0